MMRKKTDLLTKMRTQMVDIQAGPPTTLVVAEVKKMEMTSRERTKETTMGMKKTAVGRLALALASLSVLEMLPLRLSA